MNPRAEGAFEAVSYMREFTRKHGGKERFLLILEAEFDALIDDIVTGTAIDFRLRLRNPA